MPVHWSNAARHDLVRIFDFNAAYDVGRAVVVDGRIAGEAGRLARSPRIGRPVGDTAIRDWSLPDLQYVIRYRIDSGDGITILGVRHTREHRGLS